MDELEFCEKIGKGGFGHVRRGFWKQREVAIKKLSTKVLDKGAVLPFLLEISLLSETDHKNVLKVNKLNNNIILFLVIQKAFIFIY